MFAKIVQGLAQPIERLILAYLALKSPLHGADDRGRAQLRPGINDGADEILRVLARRGVRLAEMPFVDDPPTAGAHGGDFEIVFGSERLQLVHRDGVGIGCEHLHGIIAEIGGLDAAGGEVMPKHERAAFGLFNERNGNSRFDHATKRRLKWRSYRFSVTFLPTTLELAFNRSV